MSDVPHRYYPDGEAGRQRHRDQRYPERLRFSPYFALHGRFGRYIMSAAPTRCQWRADA